MPETYLQLQNIYSKQVLPTDLNIAFVLQGVVNLLKYKFDLFFLQLPFS